MKPVLPIAVLLVFMAACAPDPDEPKKPRPPTKPAAPQETEFSKPGDHGRVGVDPPGTEKPNTDVPVGQSDDAGGILGGSLSEQRYWDEIHPFEKCPEDPIYVFASSEQLSVPQCADGQGFAAVCNACEQDAYRRAVNVVRSCERAPSCKGEITQVGQKWSCSEVRSSQGVDQNGQPIFGRPWWEKGCWTQYKVLCLKS